MAKKIASLISALIIATTSLAACHPAVEISELDCPKPEVFCVGLVSGLEGIGDHSVNQQAWEGVEDAHSEKIADWVVSVETIDVKDYYKNITRLAEAGYDVVVTVGTENTEATSQAADEYPKTLFIGVDQEQKAKSPNLAGLIFNHAETSFLAGALAALTSKTGTIVGIFGSDQDPSDLAYRHGFEAGARYVNPQINILSVTPPENLTSSEAKWAASAAAQAIDNGADVVFGAGEKISKGTLNEAAKYPGIYCIGVNIDQWETFSQAHSCLLSSAVQLVTPGVFELIELAKEGNFPSGNCMGASGLAPFHDFDGSVAKTVKDEIITITAELEAGLIHVDLYPGK
jgi:basic membrane protein A